AAGRFQKVDELFLDFLIANSREKLTTPDPSPPKGEVLFVRLDPAERNEYAGWPAQPIDWQMIFNGLREADDAVIVIPEPLSWGKPSPDFIPVLAESMVPFSSIVLGVEAQIDANLAGPAFTGGLGDVMPRFVKLSGELQRAPAFSALIAAPDNQLRRHAELGLMVERRLPYVLREENTFMPSVLAQALARHTHTPYATHRFVLGPGAGAYLQSGFFVPLQGNGDVVFDSPMDVSSINALDFLSGGLVNTLSVENQARIRAAKIIVIGTDDTAQPGVARAHAQALAGILRLPRLRVLDRFEQLILWSFAALAGLWIVLRMPRQKAITRGLLFLFLTIVMGFLGFQTTLLWFPPTIPITFLSVSAVIGRLIGRRHAA
ncbi:MAG: hypothetical protein ACKO8Z_12185, partial [Prosthecobacter sp.]